MANRSSPGNLKPTFLQKIILISFGILLAIVLLEAGLRAAEFSLESLQEYRNLLSIRKNGEYKIMCIGESTTSGQYPRFLEAALNRHNLGIKFSVIDKGIGATDTSFILGQMESNIERYRPDLVVAMIGINEGGEHMPSGFDSDSKTFFKSLKINRLMKLLMLHMESKIREIQAARQGSKMSVTSLRNGRSNAAAGIQSKPNSSIQTVSVKEKGMDDNFYNNLGKQLTAKGDIPSAKQAFEKAISLNPYNVDAYYRLACLSDPAECRLIMREISEKYKSLVKGGRLSDEQNANLGHLCRILVGKNMYPEAEELCKEMLARNVMRKDADLTLARSYIEQNRYGEAEYAYKQVIELDNRESQAFDGLAVVYHETGRFNLRDQYLRKANELRPRYLPMVTIRNYKKIKNILDIKKIKLVCVQYPMRSIEPLKEIFKEEKDIIFVDNEQVFKKAVAQGYYKDFFCDFFAGDFGHCTDRGNKLLAENIADAVAKEVFHK